jgi:hypothetical protein
MVRGVYRLRYRHEARGVGAQERHAPINAANLKRVHALIESGRARGKIVLEGFGTVTR